MNENGMMTFRATASELGVSPVTISDLVNKLGISPKPMTNGKAKGLDKRDRAQIAKALKPQRVAATA